MPCGVPLNNLNMGQGRGKGIISDSSLQETFFLSFTKVMSAITHHYASMLHIESKDIVVTYSDGKLYVLVNGKLFDTVSKSAIDDIFNSMDVRQLRSRLKKSKNILYKNL